jgi:hypothetical protein
VTEPIFYLACRVADLPMPYMKCERLRCARCRLQVWVNPLRFAPVKLTHPIVSVVCEHCLIPAPHAPANTAAPPTHG